MRVYADNNNNNNNHKSEQPDLLFFQKFTSASSFCAVLAGSDLHRVRTRGCAESTPAPSLLLNTSQFSNLRSLSLTESLSSPQSLNFSSDSVSVDSLSSLSSSLSEGFPFSRPVRCSCSVSSLLNGEPQNLLAKDEDLYGADLHLVNSKAFFGGVQGLETKEIALSLASALSSYSSCSSSS